MANEGIEIEVYRYDDPTKYVATLHGVKDPEFLAELAGNGGGNIKISINDPQVTADWTLLDYKNILKIRVDGLIVGAVIILGDTSTIVGTAEKAETIRTVVGKSLKLWLDDGDVKPYGGLQPNSSDNRAFNFATERGAWYDATKWITPTIIGPVGGGPWGEGVPEKWPENSGAQWIWGAPFTGSAVDDSTTLFRYEFSVLEGTYILYMAGDNYLNAWLDGAQVVTTDSKASAFQTATRLEVFLTAGAHTLGFQVTNGIQATSNPAGLAFGLYQYDSAGVEQKIAVSGNDAAWKSYYQPPAIPGWSAGEIVLTVLAEAEARGVLFPTWLNPTFTTTHDSAGTPWPIGLDWSFNIGESLLSVVNKLEELGSYIWIDPDTYDFNITTSRGIDRSVYQYDVDGITVLKSPVIFAVGKNLTKGETQGSGKMKNSLTMKTANGWVVQESQDATSKSKYGTLESTLSTGASIDLSKQLASILFTHKSDAEEGATYEFIVTDAVPFRDFNEGDWVLAPDKKGLLVKRRIMSITTSQLTTGRPKYVIEFDTIFQDVETKLGKALDKNGGGGIGGGLSNGGPSGAINPPIVIGPSAPTEISKLPKSPAGLSISSVGSWSADGVTPQSKVTINWNPVTENTDGTETIPLYYEVWGTSTGPNGYALYASVPGNTASFGTFVPGSAWTFKVRAANDNDRKSAFSAELAPHTMVGPTTKMAAPMPPTLAVDKGILIVTSNMKLVGNIDPPPQFRYEYAIVANVADGIYTAKGAALQRDNRTTYIGGLAPGDYLVKLIAMDGARIASDPSSATQITMTSITLPDLDPSIQEAIDAASQAASDALETAGAAQTAADAAVTNTVDEWAVSASSTVPPSSGWSTSTPAWTSTNYIWQRTTITFGDGSTVTGNPVLVTGNPGTNGTNGKGITSSVVTYQASASGTTPPVGTWTSSVPSVPQGQYLWSRTVITYTDSTTSTTYSIGKIGTDGADGVGTPGSNSYLHIAYATNSTGTTGFSTTDPTGKTYMGTYSDSTVADSSNPALYTWSLIKGADGTAGKGITSSTVNYQVGSSGTSAPTGTWLSSVPSTPENQFLWTRTVIVFTDAASTTTYSVAKQGATGPQGTSVSSVTRYYQLATSTPAKPTTNPPGGVWTITEPSYTAGQKLYFTDLAVLSNGSFIYSDVSLSTAYEAAAAALEAAIVSQKTADGKNTIFTGVAQPPPGQLAATNLATNPSFETASGTVTVQTNQHPNPGATTTSNGFTTWNGSGGNVITTAAAVEPDSTSGFAYRVTWTTVGSANDGDLGVNLAGTSAGVIAGTRYTVAYKMKFSKAATITALSPYASTGVRNTYARSESADVAVASGQTLQRWITFDADQASLDSGLRVIQTLRNKVAGDWAEIFEVDIYPGDYQLGRQWFFGSSPAAGDFSYAWTGTANASTSIQTAPGVAGVVTTSGGAGIRSSDWASSGTYSLRQIPTTATRGSSYTQLSSVTAPNGFVRGKTYTILAKCRIAQVSGIASSSVTRSIMSALESAVYVSAPDAVGVTELRLTVTVPMTGSWYYDLFNGGRTGDPDVWWDDLLIVEGVYDGPYFDGSTSATEGYTFQWLGVEDASQSIKLLGGPSKGDFWWALGSGAQSEQIVGVRIWDGYIWKNYALVADSLFVPGSLGGTTIADDTITTAKIKTGQITTALLASDVGQNLDITSNTKINLIVGDINGLTADQQDLDANLAAMQTRYSFSPTDATISNPSSPFSIKITNQDIQMLQNGNPVSYWNSEEMFASQFRGDQVTLGHHKLEADSTNTGTIVRFIA